MPKKRKYPKQPKLSASKATWDRYLARVKEVAAYNKNIDKPKVEKRKIREQAAKIKSGL